ncbi:TetR/AcrR family transcriptional regulator [Streptomyces scabiei]|uniref:TetR/AcrR family transcriptional regulator n=1 Tax=Streptomyces scabiei TaxID=1930 RepID=UPI0038F7B58A
MPKVSEAHRDARRRQILDAARAVFAEKGFVRASTGDIVARSRLSSGAIYSYFPSKDHLVRAVCEDTIDRALDHVTSPDLSASPERVHGSGDGREHARLMAQIWGEAAVSPSLAEQVRRHLATAHEKAAGLIRDERTGHGLSGDPHATGAANVLLALLTGYTLRLAMGDEANPDAYVRAIHTLIKTP